MLLRADTELAPQTSFISKRIVICSVGSRGDVQPYIALGCALKSRGHTISIATELRLEPLVREFGLDFRTIYGDKTGLLNDRDPKVQKILQDGSLFGLISITKAWDAKFSKNDELESYVNSLQNADIIIAGGLCLTMAYCVAEKYKSVFIPMILGPTLPTNEFPVWPLENLTMGLSCLNKWSFNFLFSALWSQEREFINKWRVDVLHLPPIHNSRGIAEILETTQPPILIACSAMVCGPHGRVPSDYPSNATVGGFIFVPEALENQIDPEVHSFVLDQVDTRPLVYLGFGSMPVPNPITLVRLAISVCDICKCRAVIVAGWSEFGDAECLALIATQKELGTLLVISSAPHDWLFPHMRCVVHHGGIGTCAAALRAGVPQVICPFMLDQPHNARSMQRLGVCPVANGIRRIGGGIVPYSAHMTARELATPLLKILNDVVGSGGVVDRAAECAVTIRAESGSALEKYIDMILHASAVGEDVLVAI